MHEGAVELFNGKFIEDLKKNNKKLVVQYKVGEEINRLQHKEDKETRHKAKRAAKLLNTLIKEELIEARGNEKDAFADLTFRKVFTMYLNKLNLCLVTQDSGLAKDIMGLNNAESFKVYTEVKVLRINEVGQLIHWQ
jgi:uncharacterized protein YacL